jgi:hypothetical protein
MELWTAFALGMVGSLHCAGMCGPLALALPATGNSALGFTTGRVLYNCGRILTYCSLGFIFGLFGKSLLLAGIQRWISIALGLALITGLFASRKIALGRPLTRWVHTLKSGMSRLLGRRSSGSLLLLGLLNGLLPCGLVYVACAGAAMTSSALAGAAYMASFGAGTVPLMLTLGLSGKLVPLSLRLKLHAAIPVSILLLGLLLILRGMSLGIPYLSPDLAAGNCCHK